MGRSRDCILVLYKIVLSVLASGAPTVCVTCVWAGVDSAWEQKKLEAGKMLENAARREAAVPGVQCIIIPVLLRDAVLDTNLFTKNFLGCF